MKAGLRLLMLGVAALALMMAFARQRTSVVVLPDRPGGAQAGYYAELDLVWWRWVYAHTTPGGRRLEYWPAWDGPSVLWRW